MYVTHHLLLRWLLFVATVAVGLIVAWHQGLFYVLFKNDASNLSAAIVVVFGLSSLHAGWLILRLSHYINQVNTISRLMDRDTDSQIRVKDNEVIFGQSAVLPDGPMTFHIQNLTRRLGNSTDPGQLSNDQGQLLEALSKRIKSPQQLGWLIADLMIKLGLLGTVIGFILMLQSVPTVEDLDVSTIQTMLSRMSDGMRVALFTTLCGLVGGVLAGIQYHIADRGADELLAGITEVSEVHVTPRLANGSR